MKYSVVLADLEANREDILKNWERNLSSSSGRPRSAQEKYAWYYQNNPCGPSQCWLLRHNASGGFVGVAGLGLRQVKVLDQNVPAGLLVDFAVDQKHRLFLPALLLQEKVRQAVEGELGLLYCAPNPLATTVLIRAGYTKLGEMVRYATVLDVEPYLRRRMHSVPGARLFAPLANLALRLVSPHTWRGIPEEFVAREVDDFDSRFDALWERASHNFPVVAERTSKFLRWRYSLFPLRSYCIFGLLDRDQKKLLGYIIYSLENETAFIADLFYEGSDRVLVSLLSAFLRFARGKNAASVSFSFMGSDKFRNILIKCGFRRRDDKRAMVVFVRKESPLAPALLNPSNWYLVEGDQDNG